MINIIGCYVDECIFFDEEKGCINKKRKTKKGTCKDYVSKDTPEKLGTFGTFEEPDEEDYFDVR